MEQTVGRQVERPIDVPGLPLGPVADIDKAQISEGEPLGARLARSPTLVAAPARLPATHRDSRPRCR